MLQFFLDCAEIHWIFHHFKVIVNPEFLWVNWIMEHVTSFRLPTNPNNLKCGLLPAVFLFEIVNLSLLNRIGVSKKLLQVRINFIDFPQFFSRDFSRDSSGISFNELVLNFRDRRWRGWRWCLYLLFLRGLWLWCYMIFTIRAWSFGASLLNNWGFRAAILIFIFVRPPSLSIFI